jgi:hypothetical protein
MSGAEARGACGETSDERTVATITGPSACPYEVGLEQAGEEARIEPSVAARMGLTSQYCTS